MLQGDRVPPAAGIAELKAYLRIEDGVEDGLLAGLLRAATETVEAMLGTFLLERDVEERGVVACGAIALTAEPVRALVSAVLHQEGADVPVAGVLRVSKFGTGQVELAGVDEGADVAVRYRAGLAVDWNGVPEALRLSVLRAAAHFHGQRDSRDDAGLPPAVRRMLAPWRARRLLAPSQASRLA